MLRGNRAGVIAGLMILIILISGTVFGQADSFIFPVKSKTVSNILENTVNPRSSEGGWYVNNDFGFHWNTDAGFSGNSPGGAAYPYHPGMDYNRYDEAENSGNDVPVYSIGKGTVIRVKDMGSNGWAILIRYDLLEAEDLSSYVTPGTVPTATIQNASSVVAMYLHLYDNALELPSDDHRPPSPAIEVVKGQLLGNISSDLAHLHFELRAGTNDQTAAVNSHQNLGYYDNQQSITDFGNIDPEAFIEDHVNSVPALVGYFSDGPEGWHDDGTSQAFVSKYQDLKDDGNDLGNPWNNGPYGIYVHDLNGMFIQDFKDLREDGGTDNGYTMPWTALIYYDNPWMSTEAHLLKEGFWGIWMNDLENKVPGWEVLGVPVTDESLPEDDPNGYVYQCFYRFGDNYVNDPDDFQVHYLRWDATLQEIIVEDVNHQQVTWASLIVNASSPEPVMSKKVAISDPDGVYHSGLLVSDFGEAFNLIAGDSYDDFYAVISGTVFPIDAFNINGDTTIIVGDVNNCNTASVSIDESIIYVGPGLIPSGQSVDIPIRFTNQNCEGTKYAPSHAWRIYSPDGAEWSNPDIISLILFEAEVVPGFFIDVDFDYLFSGSYPFVNIGSTEDTLGYAGVVMPSDTGVFDGLDLPVLSLRFETSAGSAGRTICIDTVLGINGYTGRWEFADYPITPSWEGPYCFTIMECVDPDNDEICDYDDNCLDVSNPDQNDNDHDGFGDLCDNCPDISNPTQADIDSDGLGNACDPGEVLFTTATARCGSAPFTISFNDESVPTSSISEWYWDFGDGNFSNEQNPSHTYINEGIYDIMLQIYDGEHYDSLITEKYIAVLDSIEADFIGLPTSGRPPLTVMFEPVIEGGATEYHWDFGDGQTSNIANPIHIYNSVGLYDVKLTARFELDNCTFADSTIKTNYVVVSDLKANFTASPTAGLEPLTVNFTDSSTGTPTSWFWDFGDGITSSLQNPSHTYNESGLWDVKLRLSDGFYSDSLLKLKYIRVDSLYVDLIGEIYNTWARPGFEHRFYCVWTNLGTETANDCELKILPPEPFEFSELYGRYGVLATEYSLRGDTIVVPLGDIEPSGWYSGYVYPIGRLQEPDTVQIGDILPYKSWLTTSSHDIDPSNNDVINLVEVTGAIDPNDKTAIPAGEGDNYAIESNQRLSYLVQFENKPEATASATYVRVVDTLSPLLDWGSLAMGAMSHPETCDWSFDPYTGVIEWFCDNIMLPPNVTAPEGEGYFTYSISPIAELEPGTEIPNTAWIRFDYNHWLMAPEDGPLIRTIKMQGCCGEFTLGETGNTNCDIDGLRNLADITRLIDNIYISKVELCCRENGNTTGDTSELLNLADITRLIDHIYISKEPTSPCE